MIAASGQTSSCSLDRFGGMCTVDLFENDLYIWSVDHAFASQISLPDESGMFVGTFSRIIFET
jgi:hypothetical protein